MRNYVRLQFLLLDVNWGSSTQAQTYKTALTSVHRLTHTGEHVKNYRPQILVLAGRVHARPPLVDFANLITKNNSLLVVGEVSEVFILLSLFLNGTQKLISCCKQINNAIH